MGVTYTIMEPLHEILMKPAGFIYDFKKERGQIPGKYEQIITPLTADIRLHRRISFELFIRYTLCLVARISHQTLPLC